MYCQQCGTEIRDDAKICEKCGTVTDCSSSVTCEKAGTQSTVNNQPHSKWQSYWKAVVLGAIFLIVLAGGGFYGLQLMSQPRCGDMRVNPKDGAEMVWVPGARVTMDSIDRVGSNAVHQVTIPGYWIYKYEVTIAQYRSFCAATGHSMPPWPGNCYSWAKKSGWSDKSLQEHPIVNVTWSDAKAYADWAKVILPTEPQWEYAARGPRRLNYPWGGNATTSDPCNGWDRTKCANAYNSITRKHSTWPVGSFPAGASWCNAHDLAGNVWELCVDQYRNGSSAPMAGHGSLEDAYVLRGGSWASGEDYCRGIMRRSGQKRNSFAFYVGFRCVLPTSQNHPQPQGK